MLTDLHISNFAIIEEQAISFGPGLNVISGETGAGKSIVMQALELILGGRPKQKYLRSGTDGWQIEALFDLSRLPESLRSELPDIVDKDELVLMRSMGKSGRGKIYINGRLGTVSLLEEISNRLISICGQGQHGRLLEPAYHLALVDGFGRHAALLKEYQEAFMAWQRENNQLAELELKRKSGISRKAELEFIFEELGAAEPQPGKRAELELVVNRMANAEGLLLGVQSINSKLNDELGLYAQVNQIMREMSDLLKVDTSLEESSDYFEAALANLHEFERSLGEHTASIEVNDQELDNCREKLAEIARLERKYATNDTGLTKLLEDSKEELALLDGDLDLKAMRDRVSELERKALDLAGKLSKSRVRCSARLVKEVERELAELSLKGARLEVSSEKGGLIRSGQDRLELLISVNKGETCKPIRQIASGGELSRIMLALKGILKETSGVNVLVFDEVDTGVSGGVARAVGEKLKGLAQHSQVICITHLAQVASLADYHLLVEKVVGKRAVTQIRLLENDQKVDEIARMLAGYKVTAASRESARELMSS